MSERAEEEGKQGRGCVHGAEVNLEPGKTGSRLVRPDGLRLLLLLRCTEFKESLLPSKPAADGWIVGWTMVTMVVVVVVVARMIRWKRRAISRFLTGRN